MPLGSHGFEKAVQATGRAPGKTDGFPVPLLTNYFVYCTLTPMTSAAESLTVLDDPDRVAAALSPLRRRLLEHLRTEPDSAAGLARKLDLPRQKLNYHLRELEKAGIVELAEERQRRGCVERSLRPTARALLVDPRLLGGADEVDNLRDRFSSTYLIAAAARVLQEVTGLRAKATAAGKRLATFTLETEVAFRSAADRAAFASELTEAVAALARKYHDDSRGSRRHRFVVGGHPVPKGVGDKRATMERDR